MYVMPIKTVVLEIPKNGSRSLEAAIKNRYGKNGFKIAGHFSYGHTMDSMHLVREERRPNNPVTVVGVFRNPVERLVSQVNHVAYHRKDKGLDYILLSCIEQSNIVFKPQAEFLEDPQSGTWEPDIRMWDMSRIEEAMKFLIGADVRWHKNKRPTERYSMDQIIEHRWFEEIMEDVYKYDHNLWLKAQMTDQEGKKQ